MNDIITKYLQGEASDNEKQMLLDWLRESELNKKTFSELQDIWLSAGAPLSSELDTSKAYLRFKEKVYALEKKKNTLAVFPLYKIVATVALLICCSFIFYYAGKNSSSNNVSKVNEVIVNQVIMGKDSKGSVLLPDGTKVWLNANSKLIYPEMFSKTSRKVKLEGEAYFEVVHNEKAPFYVETENMTVNVLGTHFDVKSYSGKEFTQTVLLSGKVEVQLLNTDEKIILKPNQMISKNNRTGTYTLNDVDAKEYTIWINEKLVFTNDKLSTILSKMEHWYRVEFDCDKKISQNQRLSLTIRKETKEEIMELIGLIAHVDYRIESDKIIIRSK